MTDTTNPASGSPTDQVSQSEVGSSQTDNLDLDTEGLLPDDSEEIEHEGQKYRIAKALKPALMLQADYTRKTQELAEHRRGLDSERETFTKSAEAERQLLKDNRELVAIDWQIEQLKAVDFATLQQADPNRAQQLLWRLNQLQDDRVTKAQELQQKMAERNSVSERERASRIEQAKGILARDVEGWSDDLANKAGAFAMSQGFTQAELQKGLGDWVDHRFVKLAHLARIGSELLAKQKAATAAPAVAAAPAPRVGGGSPPAQGLSDRLSADEWLKRRNAQVRKQRR